MDPIIEFGRQDGSVPMVSIPLEALALAYLYAQGQGDPERWEKLKITINGVEVKAPEGWAERVLGVVPAITY